MKWIVAFFVVLALACSNSGKESSSPVVCPSDFDDLSLSEAKERIIGNWKLVRTASEEANQSSSLVYQFSDKFRILQNDNLINESDFQLEVDLASSIQNQLKLTYVDSNGLTQSNRIYFGNEPDCMMIQQVTAEKVESLYFQRAN